MNGQNNQWRFELRHHQNLAYTWHSVLPFSHGDCEISPLANGHWLAANSCGIRLVQISYHKLISAVEYERELKNAIILGKDYFVVRTKNTLEFHLIQKPKD
jgi:hypothetical protein